MLVSLRIDNFALVEHLELGFNQGFNVLTGETGTGKSIIIDAVDTVLGARTGSDMIRTGESKALIEAEFDIASMDELEALLSELGLEVDEEGTLILSRTINQGGKNSYRINGFATTATVFKRVGEYLIDIHGQHDNYSLVKPTRHLQLLDSFDDKKIKGPLNEYRQIYNQYTTTKKNLADLVAAQKERARRIDILQFQIQEIKAVEVKLGEDSKLLEERKLLANAEKLNLLAAKAYDLLKSGSGRQGAALDSVSEALKSVREIATIDEKLKEITELATEAYYQLEELAGQVRDYMDQLFFDPQRLEEVEERLENLRNLKRKYGDSIEDILSFAEKAEDELTQLVDSEQILSGLQDELAALEQHLSVQGQRLTKARLEVAQLLETVITEQLSQLNMPHIQFKVQHESSTEPSPQGFDQIEFLISPNPGEPLKPLAKIASGGEMARIMLALKVVLAKVDVIPTLIFDEVDAGLGGRAAQAVGEKLAQLGKEFQIMCVTHSPQVTSFADHHLMIAKEVHGERTKTIVTQLNNVERSKELARMLGGANITDLTLKHAQEMLELARQQKA